MTLNAPKAHLENKIPFPKNPLFTGREDFLRRLHNTLADRTRPKFRHRVAIYGMAGVGKTEVAVEYVHRYKAEYHRVYWIPSVDQASLLAGYQEIAVKDCRIAVDRMDSIELAHYVIRWLGRQKSWLVVLDNLDDISVVDHRLLPINGPKAHTLITTRNPTPELIPLAAEGVQVPVLDHTDALLLLSIFANIPYRPRTSEGAAADEIVQSLGYLPLAIQLAGSFVQEVTKSFVGYQHAYNYFLQNPLRKIPYGSNRYFITVSTTWSVAFDYIRSKDHRVVRLLQLFSFLNPNGLLRQFLVAGANALDPALHSIVSSPSELTAALSMLKKLSLVKSNSTNKLLSIHRLIQGAIRDEMSWDERQEMRNLVTNLCNCAFPDPNDENRDRCRLFQTQVVEPLLTILSVETPESVTIKRRVGNFLREDGKLRESQKMLEQALDCSKVVFKQQPHAETLATMQGLALTYLSLGQHERAFRMQQEVLTTFERISHTTPSYLSSAMSAMAKICEAQDELGTAVEWLEKVLVQDARIFGRQSIELVPTLSNLARLYVSIGKGWKAIESEERVVDIERKISGPGSPKTLIAINNFALTLVDEGDAERGEALLLEVLHKTGNRSELLDVTLMTMGNLALTYNAQGKYEQAMRLEELVLEKNREELGLDHEYTLRAMTNLALTYGDQGLTDESILLFEEIVERERRVKGDDDPDTLKATVDLAIANLQAKNLERTCTLLKNVLKKMVEILGEEHELTLNTMDNLSVTYKELGDSVNGDKLQARAAEVRLKKQEHRSSF